MTRIPSSKGVSKAIRSLREAALKSLSALNQTASLRMAKGDYPGAEALVAKGKEIRAFLDDIEHVRSRWKEIAGMSEKIKNNQQTPLWRYYQPILLAIVEKGGESLRTDIEVSVGKSMRDAFQLKDKEMFSRGRERWQVMIRRARKHLVQEGWIENTRGKMWVITDEGRRAATSEIRAQS